MTQASINNLNEQVQQYSLLIANKQAELEASQAEEQRLNEQYKTRIRSMEETGNISYLSLIHIWRAYYVQPRFSECDRPDEGGDRPHDRRDRRRQHRDLLQRHLAHRDVYKRQELMKTPIVRNGRQATAGYCPEVWQTWE